MSSGGGRRDLRCGYMGVRADSSPSAAWTCWTTASSTAYRAWTPAHRTGMAATATDARVT